jgi:hypothetical protein
MGRGDPHPLHREMAGEVPDRDGIGQALAEPVERRHVRHRDPDQIVQLSRNPVDLHDPRNGLDRPVKRLAPFGEWSCASIPTKTVSPNPSAAGSARATRPVSTPAATSFWIRFQHGVRNMPDQPAICATGKVASRFGSATILRSIRSGSVFGRAPCCKHPISITEQAQKSIVLVVHDFPSVFQAFCRGLTGSITRESGGPHHPDSDSRHSRAWPLPMITQKTKYALKALPVLADEAAKDQPQALTIEEIARRSDTPERFLEQTLLEVRNAGVIASIRGRSGAVSDQVLGAARWTQSTDIGCGSPLRRPKARGSGQRIFLHNNDHSRRVSSFAILDRFCRSLSIDRTPAPPDARRRMMVTPISQRRLPDMGRSNPARPTRALRLAGAVLLASLGLAGAPVPVHAESLLNISSAPRREPCRALIQAFAAFWIAAGNPASRIEVSHGGSGVQVIPPNPKTSGGARHPSQLSGGLTTVFVTHDHDEAIEPADRVVVMSGSQSGGRIEQIGKPQDIRARPAPAFVRDFVDA